MLTESSHSWKNANQGRGRSSGIVTARSPRPVFVNSCTVTDNNSFIMMAIFRVFKACSAFGSDLSKKRQVTGAYGTGKVVPVHARKAYGTVEV